MNKVYQMPSAGQIKQWKKEHGTIHKLTVKVPGQESAICIVRSPKVTDISHSHAMGDGDSYTMGKLQLESCWLDGDERIKTRLSFSQSAALQMGRIFGVFPWDIQSVLVTKQLLEKLKAQGVSAEVIEKVVAEGMVRKIAILNGAVPLVKEGKDTREIVEALFRCPDLEVKEKVDSVSDFLDQGSLFINECFLSGDKRLKDHSSEPIAFASYMAGNALIEKLTTEVEKL